MHNYKNESSPRKFSMVWGGDAIDQDMCWRLGKRSPLPSFALVNDDQEKLVWLLVIKPRGEAALSKRTIPSAACAALEVWDENRQRMRKAGRPREGKSALCCKKRSPLQESASAGKAFRRRQGGGLAIAQHCNGPRRSGKGSVLTFSVGQLGVVTETQQA